MTHGFRSDNDELVVGHAEGSAVMSPAAMSPLPLVALGQWFGVPMVQVHLTDLGVGAWRLTATMELSAEEGDNLLSSLLPDRPEDRLL